jgi:hypothetical protein
VHVYVGESLPAPGFFRPSRDLSPRSTPTATRLRKTIPRSEAKQSLCTVRDGGNLPGNQPPAAYFQLSSLSNPLADRKDFHVLINGAPLPSTGILYAGTTPERPAFIR